MSRVTIFGLIGRGCVLLPLLRQQWVGLEESCRRVFIDENLRILKLLVSIKF